MGRRVKVPVDEPVVEPDRLGSIRRRLIALAVIGGRDKHALDREAYAAGLRGHEAAEFVVDRLGLRSEYEAAVAEVVARIDGGSDSWSATVGVVNESKGGC